VLGDGQVEQRLLAGHLVRVLREGVGGEVQAVQDGLLAAREEAGHAATSDLMRSSSTRFA
jgi:hypothetical protein